MKEYVLKNDYLEVAFINIGASITRLVDLKTKNNLILAYNNLDMYRDNPYYFGCTIGRNAGRIEKARLIINDNEYKLSCNFLNKHQLHGGFYGMHLKYFQEEVGKDYIKFTALSEDGEDGFPGNLLLVVTYRLIDNELHIEYEAKSDKDTVINITNHSYFNLNLDKKQNIENHHLILNCDKYIEVDEEMIPKLVKPVENTPFDFRSGKLIGQNINDKNKNLLIANGFDHPFIINKDKSMNFVASLSNHKLKLEVYSTQDAVIFYSGNYLEGDYFRCGLCLETQGIPNNFNFEKNKRKNIYKKDERYYQHTIWKIIS